MHLEKTSFDAVITDANGLSIEVDCRITEPVASGRPAQVSIDIPMSNQKVEDLQNPCSLRGFAGSSEIEIKELCYRSISFDVTQRKHARGAFEINTAGQLSVKRTYCGEVSGALRFLLSPVRLLEDHTNAKTANYSSTPSMTVELFKLRAEGLGEIRFIKFWSFHRVGVKGMAAEICSSFAAEIQYDGSAPIDQLVSTMREVLTPLSILARQAITLHGWIWETTHSIQTMWFNPLDPNHAPDMAQHPITDVCFNDEFDACAQVFVKSFLEAPEDTKGAFTSLAVALAPHVERSIAGNFSALFGALEEVVALDKLTKEEKEKLRETDCHLIRVLLDKKCFAEAEASEHSSVVGKRLQGYADSVRTSGPSFNVRFDKFQETRPGIANFMYDLWPLKGSDKQPGLKQIRDSLAHGLRHKYGNQAIAVAHWHFARLAERLAFLVLDADVPRGISPNSSFLQREQWYAPSEWQTVQASAKGSN
jgi:hypothetical protein